MPWGLLNSKSEIDISSFFSVNIVSYTVELNLY